MTTPYRLTLSGIDAAGRHGANPGEIEHPQPFVVDLEVIVEVDDDDTLEATADYDRLVVETRRVVAEESFVLIETLATEIGRCVFDVDDDVMQVIVTVHKPKAAEALGIEDVAAGASYPPETGEEP